MVGPKTTNKLIHLKFLVAIMLIIGRWKLKKPNKLLLVVYTIYSKFMFYYFGTAMTLIILTSIYELPYKNEVAIGQLNLSILYVVLWSKVPTTANSDTRFLLKWMSDLEKEVLNTSDEKIKNIYHKNVRMANWICIAFVIMTMSAVLQLILYSYYTVFYWEETEENLDPSSARNRRPTMYLTYCNCNTDKHYVMVFCFHLVIIYGALIYYNYGEIFYVTLVTFCISLIEVLHHELKTSGSRARELAEQNNLSFEDANFMVIRDCAMKHQTVIEVVNLVQKVTKLINLLELISQALPVALTLYQLYQSREELNISRVVYLILLLLLISSQLFFIYYLANEVQLKSVQTADVIYNDILWYEYDPRLKSYLQLMMVRSQRPLVLKNGPFGEMSLGILQKVLKTTFSYFTFFQTVADKNI